jgi:CheY-like chemotaxis protein
MGWLDAAHGRAISPAAREAIEIAREHAQLGYRVARRAIGAEVARDHDRTALRVARESVVAVRPEAQRRGVRVAMQQLGQGDVLLHSPVVAQQIVLNLLLNAISFTPTGGVVTLELRNEGDCPVFVVSDQGPGIPPERAENLFSAPESTRCGGAGIGLKHSCALAQAHGGVLKLLHPGPGATFELRWSVGEARSGTHHNDVAVASLATRRVLVVEDDLAVVSLIELALEARGAVVLPARSKDELAQLLASEAEFDVALVDLSPIASDIHAALAGMQSGRAGLPLILISGVASGIPDEVDGQFTDWVRKPFTMDEVVAALQRVLERPQSA